MKVRSAASCITTCLDKLERMRRIQLLLLLHLAIVSISLDQQESCDTNKESHRSNVSRGVPHSHCLKVDVSFTRKSCTVASTALGYSLAFKNSCDVLSSSVVCYCSRNCAEGDVKGIENAIQSALSSLRGRMRTNCMREVLNLWTGRAKALWREYYATSETSTSTTSTIRSSYTAVNETRDKNCTHGVSPSPIQSTDRKKLTSIIELSTSKMLLQSSEQVVRRSEVWRVHWRGQNIPAKLQDFLATHFCGMRTRVVVQQMNLTICTILTAVIAFAEGAETADLTVVNGHSNVVASGVEDEDAEVKVADTPEFLKLATDSQRKEYIELEANMNVPVGATRKAQDLWAKKIGEPVLSAYEKHVAAEDAAKASETARMDRAVAKLSQAARTADQFIRGIYSNDSLTRKQINAEVTRQMKLLPKKVYNELTLAIQ